MLIRALIVLLLVLNLGVAAWWLTRAPPQPTPSAASSAVPPLKLVEADNRAAATVATPAPMAISAPERCASYGPFASAQAAGEARQQVQSFASRVRVREVATGPYRGWKVWLPPYASIEEVEAVSARVAAAGFSDRFVVREGRDARSLALGRFAGEAPARQHAAAVVAAGFPARAEAIGTGPASHWLDVAGRAEDLPRLQRLAAAAESRELDCSTWR